MQGQGRWIATGLALAVALLALAGCGKSDSAPTVSVSDGKIIQAANLIKMGHDFTIDGDTSCMVSNHFLNTPADVAAARKDPKTKVFVVEASKGGYGLVGEPIFPASCGKRALQGLDKVKLPKQ